MPEIAAVPIDQVGGWDVSDDGAHIMIPVRAGGQDRILAIRHDVAHALAMNLLTGLAKSDDKRGLAGRKQASSADQAVRIRARSRWAEIGSFSDARERCSCQLRTAGQYAGEYVRRAPRDAGQSKNQTRYYQLTLCSSHHR